MSLKHALTLSVIGVLLCSCAVQGDANLQSDNENQLEPFYEVLRSTAGNLTQICDQVIRRCAGFEEGSRNHEVAVQQCRDELGVVGQIAEAFNMFITGLKDTGANFEMCGGASVFASSWSRAGDSFSFQCGGPCNSNLVQAYMPSLEPEQPQPKTVSVGTGELSPEDIKERVKNTGGDDGEEGGFDDLPAVEELGQFASVPEETLNIETTELDVATAWQLLNNGEPLAVRTVDEEGNPAIVEYTGWQKTEVIWALLADGAKVVSVVGAVGGLVAGIALVVLAPAVSAAIAGLSLGVKLTVGGTAAVALIWALLSGQATPEEKAQIFDSAMQIAGELDLDNFL
ncbi:MAG: hypothetical protein IPJ88_03880 [Myxococcales bacterium]|nr:MAG: hypothetical protein IPJ88_03880 [Myxococcales bacterium]